MLPLEIMSFSLTDESTIIQRVQTLVRSLMTQGRPIRISIDGIDGSGKTTLADKLAKNLGGKVISFDKYLIPHKGIYLSYIRYAELSSDLAIFEEEATSVIILEGLCLLSVLERLSIEPEISVYIRRVDTDGIWLDEIFNSEDNDVNDVLRRLDKIENRRNKPGIADKDRELARYHIEKKPITDADFVFDRRFPTSHEIVVTA